jgi:hypothetical protein
MKIRRPDFPPYTLNNAIDFLLKKEFDLHRKKAEVHPFLKEIKLNYVPANNPSLQKWRNYKYGISHLVENLDLEIYGAIDDIWENINKEIIIIEYKCSAQKKRITELNGNYHNQIKRQLDLYNWLLNKNEENVSKYGYFLFCNLKTETDNFNANLNFDLDLIKYECKTDWIMNVLNEISNCLKNENIPEENKNCKYCSYINLIKNA